MIKEVEQKLKSFVPQIKKQTYFEPASYMGTGFLMLGLNVPLQRKIFKEGYSFSTLPLIDELKIWDQVWKEAEIFEVLTQALFFPEKNMQKFDTDKLFKVLKVWVKKVDNWGHSDTLSSIIAKMLVNQPDYIFTQLKKWNQAKNPWERRQSIVPIAMYHRRNFQLGFTPCIQLIQRLLHDEDYFVQKGVGWTLREIGTQYPAETWKFLQKNAKQISPIAFSASIEKIDSKKKDVLKALRKNK